MSVPSRKPQPSAREQVRNALLEGYLGDKRARRIARHFLPSREAVEQILQLALDLIYPGYFRERDLTEANLDAYVTTTLERLEPMVMREIEHCLCYGREVEDAAVERGACAARAADLMRAFIAQLPRVRAVLIQDVQAAYDGDPAASNLDEIVLAYPGMLAVSVFRIAHVLYELGVPMMPRIMTEWAHSRTGTDIHPGATIGAGFFIDHATGVVIGETTVIGEKVKLYQGVTLGALSFPRDSTGQIIRGRKRHPTVEDHCTLYANATVLGGDTVIGAGSVIGGGVFITRSLPPRSRVSLKEPALRVDTRGDASQEPGALYFDI
jgi:serine O-acetyltransferase